MTTMIKSIWDYNVEMPPKRITISVIIPMYNAEKNIVRALESVRLQTLVPYEVILIDDGSKDATIEVVERYLNGHREFKEHVKMLSQDNGGVAAARNTGIRVATGEWISFLDSDDYWKKNRISRVIKEIEKNPDANMISHGITIVDQLNGIRYDKALGEKRYNCKKDLFPQLYRGNFLTPSAAMVKRKLIENAGGFDTTFNSAQDYDLWLKLSLKGAKLHYFNDCLTCYTIRPCSASCDIKKRYSCVKRIKLRYCKFLKKYIPEKRVFLFSCMAIVMNVLGEAKSIVLRHDIKGGMWLLLKLIKDMPQIIAILKRRNV